MVAADWLNDLGEFGAPIVADACQMWRRTEQRKPTIADIRKLCLEVTPKPAKPLALPNPHGVREFETDRNRRYAEAAEARQKWAEEHGCKDFAQVMERGILGRYAAEPAAPKPLSSSHAANLIAQARARLRIADEQKPGDKDAANG